MTIATIKSARRRAVAMGKPVPWRPAFDAHPLAAPVDNHLRCLEAAIEDGDFLAALGYIDHMADHINAYADAHRCVGDDAAQYWLERFLWHCDAVAQIDKLPS